MRKGESFPKYLPAFVLLIVWLPLVSGCAAKTLPPSESTVVLLQGAYKDMRALVDSGQTPPIEARDRFYQILVAVDPPLPGLDQLLDDRRHRNERLVLRPQDGDGFLKADGELHLPGCH